MGVGVGGVRWEGGGFRGHKTIWPPGAAWRPVWFCEHFAYEPHTVKFYPEVLCLSPPVIFGYHGLSFYNSFPEVAVLYRRSAQCSFSLETKEQKL